MFHPFKSKLYRLDCIQRKTLINLFANTSKVSLSGMIHRSQTFKNRVNLRS